MLSNWFSFSSPGPLSCRFCRKHRQRHPHPLGRQKYCNKDRSGTGSMVRILWLKITTWYLLHWGSHMFMTMDNHIPVDNSLPDPFTQSYPSPSDLGTLLLEWSFFKLWLYRYLFVVGVRRRLIDIKSWIEDRHSYVVLIISSCFIDS
jgi:hypothetical protein